MLLVLLLLLVHSMGCLLKYSKLRRTYIFVGRVLRANARGQDIDGTRNTENETKKYTKEKKRQRRDVDEYTNNNNNNNNMMMMIKNKKGALSITTLAYVVNVKCKKES